MSEFKDAPPCPVCKGPMADGNLFCSKKCFLMGSDEEIELSEVQEKILEFIKLKYGTPCENQKLRELQVDIKQAFGGI